MIGFVWFWFFGLASVSLIGLVVWFWVMKLGLVASTLTAVVSSLDQMFLLDFVLSTWIFQAFSRAGPGQDDPTFFFFFLLSSGE